jgi:hypothetical protein
MSVTSQYLADAGAVIRAAATLRDAASLWRARHPAMRVLVVDAMDMRDETPALRLGTRSVYLASTNGHCWSVTDKVHDATALILTQE